MGKPFPQQKAFGPLPPDVQQLIDKCGGVIRDAERAAGVGFSTFSKIRAGRIRFTPFLQDRVANALNNLGENNMPPNNQPLTIPATCPPLLADLMRHLGTKRATIELLGVGNGYFYRVMGGTQKMPAEWIIKAKAALGQPVIGIPHEEPPPDHQIPDFVPWDGKLVTVMVRGVPGTKPKPLKGVPEPLAKLIDKLNGSRTGAANAMGRTAGYLSPFLTDPKNKFGEKAQRAVHQALHDVPPQDKHSMGEDYDKYSLGLAIVMTSATSFDRIQELAEVLNGRLVFRKNTKTGWLILYKMAIDDLPRFKRLALRDANEIVCP